MRSSASLRSIAMPAMWVAMSMRRVSTGEGSRTDIEYIAKTPNTSPWFDKIGVDQHDR